MAPSSPATLHSYAADTQIWTHLKTAIANSSGFKRWTLEQQLAPVNEATADPFGAPLPARNAGDPGLLNLSHIPIRSLPHVKVQVFKLDVVSEALSNIS
jgi:hypothetical protein